MNVKEYLMLCAIEELGEIAKEISKCMRFTPGHVAPEYGTSNVSRVEKEIAEFYAVIEMLKENNIGIRAAPFHFNEEQVSEFLGKKMRLKAYMERSRELGTLQGKEHEPIDH